MTTAQRWGKRLLESPWRYPLGLALVLAGVALVYLGATTGLQWGLATTGAFSRPSRAAADLMRNLGLVQVVVGVALANAGRLLTDA